MRTAVRDLAELALRPSAPGARPQQPRRGACGGQRPPQVGLVEALELVLLVSDRAPEKYDRAALRWTVRYARETTGVTLADAQAILALLAVLPARREPAAHALSDLLYRRGLERACEALNSWASRNVGPHR
jgi:hypothetical protein